MTDKQSTGGISEFFAREKVLHKTMEECIEIFDELNVELGDLKLKFDTTIRDALYEYVSFVYDGALEYYDNNSNPEEQLRAIDAVTLDRMIKTLLLERMSGMRDRLLIDRLMGIITNLKYILTDG